MSPKKKILLFKIFISFTLLGWLIHAVDWTSLRAVFLSAEPGWLLLAVFLIILSMIVSVQKWALVLKAEGLRVKWSELWQTYWIGLFFNNFLPSGIGGDGMRILLIGRAVSNMSGSASSVLVERLLATMGLAVAGLLAGLIYREPDRRVGWLFLALILVSLGLLFLLLWCRVPTLVQKNKGRISTFIREFLSHGQALRGQGNLILGAGFLSVIFQLTVVGVNYAIFRGLHINVLTWWDLVYIIPAISALAMIPIGINGYGVRESAYVFLLASYGVTNSSALAASLLFAVLVSVCSLYGGFLWIGYRGREVVKNDRETNSQYC